MSEGGLGPAVLFPVAPKAANLTGVAAVAAEAAADKVALDGVMPLEREREREADRQRQRGRECVCVCKRALEGWCHWRVCVCVCVFWRGWCGWRRWRR